MYGLVVRGDSLATKLIPIFVVLTVSSFLVIVLCTLTGPTGFGVVIPSISTGDIILGIRLPRVLAAFFVGASLAIAGAALQALLKNPLVDPYILGTSSGGALGATLAIVFLGGIFVPIFAWIGAVLAILIVLMVAGREYVAVETLVLAGIAVSLFFSALVSFLIARSGESIRQIMFWLMGGFWNASLSDVILSTCTLFPVGIFLFFMGRDLNALSLGDEPARHLGINALHVRWSVIGGSTLLVAAAVSIAGPISFVGLVTPHVVRMFLGPDNRILIPACIFVGGMLLVLSDTVTRTFFSDLPVGIFTAMIGAPLFLWLICYRRMLQ